MTSRDYYEANKEQVKARVRQYRLDNPEKVKESQRRYALSPKGQEIRRAYGNAYYQANKAQAMHRQRTYELKKLYGLTREAYESMLDEQMGLCLICQKPMTPAAVDHDHATGAVRGLLCRPCNTAIGLMGDDPQMVERALQYLTRSSSGATSTPSRPLSKGRSTSED